MGNRRIGRALTSAILRRRGLTGRITVPLASVMLTRDSARALANADTAQQITRNRNPNVPRRSRQWEHCYPPSRPTTCAKA